MKFKKFMKDVFTKRIPIKLLAILFTALVVIIVNC